MTQHERDDLLLNPRPGSAAARARDFGVDLSLTLFKRAVILAALQKTDGNRPEAARTLGLSQSYFNRLIHILGI